MSTMGSRRDHHRPPHTRSLALRHTVGSSLSYSLLGGMPTRVRRDLRVCASKTRRRPRRSLRRYAKESRPAPRIAYCSTPRSTACSTKSSVNRDRTQTHRLKASTWDRGSSVPRRSLSARPSSPASPNARSSSNINGGASWRHRDRATAVSTAMRLGARSDSATAKTIRPQLLLGPQTVLTAPQRPRHSRAPTAPRHQTVAPCSGRLYTSARRARDGATESERANRPHEYHAARAAPSADVVHLGGDRVRHLSRSWPHPGADLHLDPDVGEVAQLCELGHDDRAVAVRDRPAVDL